ncbi:MAG: methyltransferase domain-containing protein [Beijerinckiaceae bacterium]
MTSKIQRLFVSLVYADHNRSGIVKDTLNEILNRYDRNSFILNIGSGDKRIRPNVKNLDIFEGEHVDLIGSAESIPLDDNSVDLVISQEAFEHIQNPELALRECYRILRPGGRIYFQVPFIIGYHPGPTDFIRFTKEGVIEFLTRVGFEVERIEITVAGATGFYRIAVEFFAILFSGPVRLLYLPLKAFFALILYPIKLLDAWFRLSPQRHRIPGGYFAVAHKPSSDTNL